MKTLVMLTVAILFSTALAFVEPQFAAAQLPPTANVPISSSWSPT
jgi:hypothetical protein